MTYPHVSVVAPSFEPSPDVIPFVESVLREFDTVVIVDDGSGPAFAEIFDRLRQLGCVVLTHPQNRGKGRALKTAFAYLQATGVDVVTVDSDGQHLLSDVRKVADRLEQNRAAGISAMVLGVRDFGLEIVPWRSRFGNRTTSIVVRILFGRYLADTQTGLRGIPADQLVPLQHVRGERFDYEMNALLQTLTTKAAIQEIPITTVYHDVGNSQSHFRPVRDSIQVFFQILRFASSSLLGSLVDLGIYAGIVDLVFHGSADAMGIVSAVVIARIVSSTVNFFLNRRLVFHDRSRLTRVVGRYYALALGLLAASATGSVLFSQLFDGHLVWAKVLVDTLLFGVSYVLQKRWVFVDNSLNSAS